MQVCKIVLQVYLSSKPSVMQVCKIVLQVYLASKPIMMQVCKIVLQVYLASKPSVMQVCKIVLQVYLASKPIVMQVCKIVLQVYLASKPSVLKKAYVRAIVPSLWSVSQSCTRRSTRLLSCYTARESLRSLSLMHSFLMPFGMLHDFSNTHSAVQTYILQVYLC